MTSGPLISVVLPCLDEAETVGPTVLRALEGIRRTGRSGEVVVVDNGSVDRSAEMATTNGARVVAESRPGYGAALLRGFAEAHGEILVMADADDTYELDNLPALIDRLDDGADLAIANRYSDMPHDAMPWLHRNIGTPTINWLLRRAYGVQVGDSQSGYRAFTRDCLQRLDLRSSGMELASEMLAKAAIKGMRVDEVPSTYLVRRGESKLRTFRDGWRHLRLILTLTPTILYIVPGVILSLLGVVTFALAFSVSSGLDVGGLTWQPVFAGPIFVIVGFNATAMGIAVRGLHIRRGLRQTSGIDRWSRFLGLETVLVGAALAILAGIAIDIFIFTRWVGDAAPLLAGPQLAATAQTLIVVGTNAGLVGFLTASFKT